MRLAFFEDQHALNLAPLSLMRPVFELVCGQHTLRERLLHQLEIESWGAYIRPTLVDTYREAQPDAQVNDIPWLTENQTLLINGRWLADPRFDWNQITLDNVGIQHGTVVWMLLDPEEAIVLTEEKWDEQLAQIADTRETVNTRGTLVTHPWNLVVHNPVQLEADFVAAPLPQELPEHVAILGAEDQFHIDPTATIDPFVVLDAREGPITIAAGAKIQSFSRLEGPCYIGPDTQVFRALVREGTTIGPVCRVGGEIEASILHSYVNKYHEGFLGHAYVCPWVNLGALTSNSDLKSDYSSVSVPIGGSKTDTGEIKVGCYIGDHTKTAIGSLFNTGSAVGVMCMILPGAELLPKHIPSFTRFWNGELADGWELERSLETARVAMSRRGFELTQATERLLRALVKQTQIERGNAIAAFQEKRQQNQDSTKIHWK